MDRQCMQSVAHYRTPRTVQYVTVQCTVLYSLRVACNLVHCTGRAYVECQHGGTLVSTQTLEST